MESDTDLKKTDNSTQRETHASVMAMEVIPVRFPPKSLAISKLTLRILAINILALAIVVGGIFYLDQYQRGLRIERLEALQTDTTIFAAALADRAVRRVSLSGQIEQIEPESSRSQKFTFFIDRKLSMESLLRFVLPVERRARLFNHRGELIVDTRFRATGSAEVRLTELPPPGMIGPAAQWFAQMNRWVDRRLNANLQLYIEYPDQTANHYLEAGNALYYGDSTNSVQRLEDGSTILLAAAPIQIQPLKHVIGALLLTADTADIDALVHSVRGDMLLLSGMAFLITALLSIYLARSIARPIRRLAASAGLVTRDLVQAPKIPDLSKRHDEIGDLSVALRQMTETLWERIEAVERFAADVAHELKNPLASARSSADTLQRVDDEHTRNKLVQLLNDDIHRMDRLITDISAASRLDAELARGIVEPIDVQKMLATMVEFYGTRANLREIQIKFISEFKKPTLVQGIEDQLAQVFRNLLDNAISFSPPFGTVNVCLNTSSNIAEVFVEDEGPGLPENSIESVFERFYSERPPEEKFGNHSGLGLSIAKQIVEAHGGEILASNRKLDENGDINISGARFTLRFPILNRK